MRRRLLLLSIVGPALAVVSVQTPAVTAQLVVASFATHHRRHRRTGLLLLLVQGARDVTDDVTVARPRLVAVAAGGSDRWTIIRVSKQS